MGAVVARGTGGGERVFLGGLAVAAGPSGALTLPRSRPVLCPALLQWEAMICRLWQKYKLKLIIVVDQIIDKSCVWRSTSLRRALFSGVMASSKKPLWLGLWSRMVNLGSGRIDTPCPLRHFMCAFSYRRLHQWDLLLPGSSIRLYEVFQKWESDLETNPPPSTSFTSDCLSLLVISNPAQTPSTGSATSAL